MSVFIHAKHLSYSSSLTFFSRPSFRTTDREACCNLVPQHEGRRETLGTRSLRISHTWTSKFAGFLLKTRKHEISSGVRTEREICRHSHINDDSFTVLLVNNDARPPNLYQLVFPHVEIHTCNIHTSFICQRRSNSRQHKADVNLQ